MGKAKLRWNEPLISQHESAAEGFTPEDFTEEDRLISKTTESFVKNEVMPLLESIDQQDHESVKKLFQKAGELGLLSIEVPEDCGGLSLSKKLSGLVAEKMGAGGSFSVSFNIHAGVGTLPYIYYGNRGTKTKIPSKTGIGRMDRSICSDRAGRRIGCFNYKTTAVLNREGTAWILNGEKQWITNAQVADVYVVFAKTAEGMTAFIVERSFKGVSIGPEREEDGNQRVFDSNLNLGGSRGAKRQCSRSYRERSSRRFEHFKHGPLKARVFEHWNGKTSIEPCC